MSSLIYNSVLPHIKLYLLNVNYLFHQFRIPIVYAVNFFYLTRR